MPIGSNFDDFLKQQGIYEIACASAVAKAQMLEAKDRTNLRRHWIMVALLVMGLLACCMVVTGAALAQTPEPTAIKYPDATASPAVKAAFAQALEKCQTELRADYDRKMAKAVADGKPHLVAVYERRRDEALVSLCQLTAENAAGKSEIAANRADIAAMNQNIAANRAVIAANIALGALYTDTKRLADKITSRTETPKDIADLQRTHQALKDMHAANPTADTAEVISLLDGVLAKYKRLQ